ncbi:MAG: ferrous iron transport protein A [Cognaticolwellia sp.]
MVLHAPAFESDSGAPSLAGTALRTPVTISSVGGERSFRRRLLELGLLPGTVVEIIRVAPLGDPMEISLRGSRLSIRREEAAQVRIKPLGELAIKPVQSA